MEQRHAQCACGQLSLVAQGEPVRISICHCRACQRRTGSAFGIQARFPAAAVAMTGRSASWRRTGDSGGSIDSRFCPDCGGTVWYTLDAAPGMVAVPIGCFADPGFPAPTVSVYDELRHHWLRLPARLTRRE
jgi:hypothetical protein